MFIYWLWLAHGNPWGFNAAPPTGTIWKQLLFVAIYVAHQHKMAGLIRVGDYMFDNFTELERKIK